MTKALKYLLVFLTLMAWVLSGWPVVWQNPRIPPKITEAQAALISYVGTSNLIATNGGAPGAITPNAATQDGDLLVFYHYSRAAGGNETVALAPFNFVFNSIVTGRGLVAVGWRIKQAGDTTFTATITNHTASTTGETVLEWIETYRGVDPTDPVVNYTPTLSNWTSSLNLGPIAEPATATVHDGDMVVVFGGRFDNVVTQTVLAGDNLTWVNRTLNNTNSGSDAGAVTQTGLNSTGSDQTVTAKTITTSGTAQVGAGRMFILEKAPNNAPSLVISQPDGTDDTVIAGQTYSITYDLSDAEDAATVDFYYDTDEVGLNGVAITDCQGRAEGTGAQCSWNTIGITPGTYYIYGIATDGANPTVNDYSPGLITIQAAVVSVTVTDSNVSYGMVPANTARGTLAGELDDMQTATNNGNVTENFNIRGQDASGGGCTWTLAPTNGSDQYIHQFCNDADNDCTSPPTNYTALTTGYQSLKTGVAVSGTAEFQLRLTTPTNSSCYDQQSVDITIQAVQQ